MNILFKELSGSKLASTISEKKKNPEKKFQHLHLYFFNLFVKSKFVYYIDFLYYIDHKQSSVIVLLLQ